jgi:hypothetical protein
MNAEYPFYLFNKIRGQVFPVIMLPEEYQELIPKFYEKGGRERIEDFAKILDNSLEGIFGKPDIKLRWDEKKGLVHISIGPSGGLDLSDSEHYFQEHNLGSQTSLIAGAIATNYIHELLKLE